MGGLTAEQRSSWVEHGFFIVPGFADESTCTAMLDRAVELCRMSARGERLGTSLVDPERNPWAGATQPEDFVSKVFILHTNDPTFAPFTVDHTYARLREHADAMGEMPDSIHEAAAEGDAESPYLWIPVRRAGVAVTPAREDAGWVDGEKVG